MKKFLRGAPLDNRHLFLYTRTVAKKKEGRRAKDQRRAAQYAKSIVAGLPPREAARIAGYSDCTNLKQIERPGGPVSRIIEALEAKGLNDDYLAAEYAEGIELSKSPAAKDADCNAHAKYLLQLGYLRGHGRHAGVAVQINNNTRSDPKNDDGSIGATLSEIGELLQMVKAELRQREPSELHGGCDPVAGGDPIPAEVEPHPGMGEAG